jgi:hypothetical protein
MPDFDLITPLKLATLVRLQGHVGAPVFDHIPDGQMPPAVVMDTFTLDDEGDKQGDLWRVSLTVQVIAQGRSRDQHRAIMGAVRGQLTRWRPVAAGCDFGAFMFVSSGEQTLGDGLTHLGDVQLQIFAQPA